MKICHPAIPRREGDITDLYEVFPRRPATAMTARALSLRSSTSERRLAIMMAGCLSFLGRALVAVVRMASSWAKQDLDGAPLVHGLVPGTCPLERQFEIEDLPWVDLAVPDEVNQLRQVLPDRGWAAV